MRRFVRWLAFIAIGLLAVAAIGYGIVVVASNRALDQRVAVTRPAPVLGHGKVERGRHIFNAVSSCVVCHGQDGGGGPFINEPNMAVLYAPNLTRGPGGIGAAYTDADYDRAIRRGIRADGTRLLFMPSWAYAALTDDDAASLIAYLRSLTPVDRVTPRVRLGPLGRVLVATNKLPIDATRIEDEVLPPPPQLLAPVEHGKYLARIGGCMSCHGAHLSGGHLAGGPDVPPASNLTPAGLLRNWTEVDFMRALTKGTDKAGHPIDPFMPWRTIRGMTDDELEAIFTYLKTVPPRADGNG